MTSQRLKQIGNTVRKTIAPTPQELNERTKKLRERNNTYEEKVKALESRKREQTRAVNLRERELKARQPVTTTRRSSSGQYRDPSTAFDVFANHPLFGGGSTKPNDAFSTHPLFGGKPTQQRTTQKRTTQKRRQNRQQKPPKEFDWNLI